MNKLMRMGLWLGMLALLGGLAPRAEATDYNDNATGLWTNNSVWNPSTGYPGLNDTAVIDSHTVSLPNSLLAGMNAPTNITVSTGGTLQLDKTVRMKS